MSETLHDNNTQTTDTLVLKTEETVNQINENIEVAVNDNNNENKDGINDKQEGEESKEKMDKEMKTGDKEGKQEKEEEQIKETEKKEEQTKETEKVEEQIKVEEQTKETEKILNSDSLVLVDSDVLDPNSRVPTTNPPSDVNSKTVISEVDSSKNNNTEDRVPTVDAPSDITHNDKNDEPIQHVDNEKKVVEETLKEVSNEPAVDSADGDSHINENPTKIDNEQQKDLSDSKQQIHTSSISKNDETIKEEQKLATCEETESSSHPKQDDKQKKSEKKVKKQKSEKKLTKDKSKTHKKEHEEKVNEEEGKDVISVHKHTTTPSTKQTKKSHEKDTEKNEKPKKHHRFFPNVGKVDTDGLDNKKSFFNFSPKKSKTNPNSPRKSDVKPSETITANDVKNVDSPQEQSDSSPISLTPGRIRTETSWSNSNRNQFRKSITLSTSQLDLKSKDTIKSNVEMYEEMVIEFNNTFDRVNAARSHLNEIVKNHSSSRVRELLALYEEIVNSIQRSSSEVILDDTDKFNELKELNVFMADMYQLGFEQFKSQTTQLLRLMTESKKFLEESKECIKCKNEFDKVNREYSKVCLRMTEEKDEKKSKMALQTRDELISKGIGDGRKALEVFDKSLKKYYEILQSSGQHMVDVTTKNSEKIHQTVDNVEDKVQIWGGLDFNDEGIDEGELQDWMKESNIKKIITNEFMYVNSLTILLERYYNDITNSTLLVQTGICLGDIDTIFNDIVPLVNLHQGILKQLKTSNSKEFLDCYLAYYDKLYQQYQHYLQHHQESQQMFLKCMKHKLFREAVENIDIIEDLEMSKLLQAPTEYISFMYENIQNESFDKEVTTNLHYVFEKLYNKSQQTKQQIESAIHMSKVRKFDDPKPQSRIFFGKVTATCNKVVGNILVFSDVLLFAKSERRKMTVVSQIPTDQIDGEVTKDKNIVEVKFSENHKGAEKQSFEFIMKNSNGVETFLRLLEDVKHELTKYHLFGKEIMSAAHIRNESYCFIPKVLHQLFDKCDKEAPDQEGVLRISVNVVKLDELIKRFNKCEDIDVDALDVHVAINVLKKYCNSIPNKLPLELQVVDLEDDPIGKIRSIIFDIKNEAYIAFIERLFRLLHSISEKSETNLMNSTNLSKVISPNIYVDDAVFDVDKLTTTVTYMIEKYEEVFLPFREYNNQIRKQREDELVNFSAMQKQMESAKYSDTKASSVIVDDGIISDPKNLLLKDVMYQSEVECVELKKSAKRWIIITKSVIVFKKAVNEFNVLLDLPVDGLVIEKSDKVTLSNGGKSIILSLPCPVLDTIQSLIK
ncbi:Rho-GAP domain-containing protein [Entamoeba marina]